MNTPAMPDLPLHPCTETAVVLTPWQYEEIVQLLCEASTEIRNLTDDDNVVACRIDKLLRELGA